jgi:hypothetical protein
MSSFCISQFNFTAAASTAAAWGVIGSLLACSQQIHADTRYAPATKCLLFAYRSLISQLRQVQPLQVVKYSIA